MNKIKILSVLLCFIAISSLGQTTIADNSTVNGTWTVANSPYIIEGRAIVPNGQTLTIEPGVEVQLRSSASPTVSWFDYSAGNVGVIRVQGEIIANGTVSNPILFTRTANGYWGTIFIDEDASTSSSFSHCIIEYSKESRNITGITAPTTFDAGISIYKTPINFQNNELRENRGAGMYILEVSNAFDFSNNEFHDNGTNGLVISQSTVNAKNNSFYNNSFAATGFVSAIRCSESEVYLVGNLIYNNDDFGIFTTNNGNVNVVNNTIFGNLQGIRVENGANTYITNSIIQNNDVNFATSGSIAGATIEMQFSLTDDSSFPTNVTDVAGNILNADAQFVNSGSADFSLQSTSPCIDNGNPNTAGFNLPSTDLLGNNRIDNNTIDIGAVEYQQPVTSFMVSTEADPISGGTTNGAGTFASGTNVTVSASPNPGYQFINWTENGMVVSTSPTFSFTLSADRNLVANFEATTNIRESASMERETVVFPNPTRGSVEIKNASLSSVAVFNLLGEFILNSTSTVIDFSEYPAGVYFLNITSSNGNTTIKKLVKH